MASFEGGREELEVFLSAQSDKFYVYELMRPNGDIFYVGKGANRRVIEHELEARRNHPIGETNPFKCNVIRKILREGGEIRYRIDSTYPVELEKECLVREAELIQAYGRLHEGGPLTNLAGGVGSTSGAAPRSAEKHAATLAGDPKNNPERATLNRFLQNIGPVGSVPIKPIGQISRILPTTPHPNKRSPTARCAYALVASATAHGLQFRDGVRVPRAFFYEGVEGIIENGVARDMLKAGMVKLISSDNAKDEKFELDKNQCSILELLVGAEHLSARGLI